MSTTAENLIDIAVIGMSCRVAGANSPSELWDLLVSSRDVQREITRFNMEAFYQSDGGSKKGLTNVKNAYMLDDAIIDRFDHVFFHTTPNEAVAMDPQQRMLLEIVYEAVENAGIPLENFVGTNTAVFAGMDGSDYHSILTRDIEATPRYLATGTASCMAANRISYFFDLSGASMSLDTACSSTMAALHQAVKALQRGESSMALVCGAKLILTPDMFIPSSELGFLSPKGRCHSFDALGDGYGRGEGVLALLLKPLEDAIAAKDLVRAVIKGVALNQDGRTQGITLPSADAQMKNIDKLYKDQNIDPIDIQYLEAHGTGTAAGDPIEFSAINSVFADSHVENPLVVGSIKSNIGHLEACAALAAIIKTIQCLENGKIPAQMHFHTPNPKIDFRNSKIPTQLLDWPPVREGHRRAAVNTFGAGGTNGHAVLEEFPQLKRHSAPHGRRLLFRVSAEDNDSLQRLCAKYAGYVEHAHPDIQDLAYTLLTRRSHLRQSYFFTACTLDEVVSKLACESIKTQSKSSNDIKDIVFIFTGQGAQWPQMGKVLLELSPVFKAVLNECDKALASLPDCPSWSIITELSRYGNESRVYQSEFSQPLCTALQLGLAALWKSWGLVPSSVVGHSSGEIAAAYAAGFLSVRDSIIIAYYRGLCLSSTNDMRTAQKGNGAMCAIGTNEAHAIQILEEYQGRVDLAAVNSPDSCTLSGDRDAIKDIYQKCTNQGIFCRELKIDIAYHSHHMLSVSSIYEELLVKARIVPLTSASKCSMFSSVTGKEILARDCLPSYWMQNMVSTVRFSEALVSCLESNTQNLAMVELGPHPALQGPTKQILRGLGKDSTILFTSIVRGKNDLESMLDSVGSMIASRISLDTAAVNSATSQDGIHDIGNLLTDLPSYAWNHSTSLWYESRISKAIRFRRFSHHDLLGSRYLEDIPSHPSWRNLLTLKEVPWLLEFSKVPTSKTLPSSVFIMMALEAARQLHTVAQHNDGYLELSNILFEHDFSLSYFENNEIPIELHLNADQIDTDNFKFVITSWPTDESSPPIRHCSGILGWVKVQNRRAKLINKEVTHDPVLLQRAEMAGMSPTNRFRGLRVGSKGQTGSFDASQTLDGYCIDPRTLNDILDLPSISVLGLKLPLVTKLTFIRSILAPINFSTSEFGHFKAETDADSSVLNSNIEISIGENSMFYFSDLRLDIVGPLRQMPLPGSLFFGSRTLPDITTLSSSDEAMGISKCLDLINHKWPMSDIGVSGLTTAEMDLILGHLYRHKRKRFRSIHVEGDSRPATADTCIGGEFDSGAELHLIFASDDSELNRYTRSLRPHGFLCLRSVNEFESIRKSANLKNFSKIAIVTGFDSSGWSLWRKTGITSKALQRDNTVVFADPDQDISLVDCAQDARIFSLQPEPITEFCRDFQTERYDAIVLDSTEQPVLGAWSGDVLIPWLQNLLKLSKSIMWISRQDGNNPFGSLAAEKLSVVQNTISSLYDDRSMMHNEVHYEMKNGQLYIKRYYPDDELSALTGVALPCPVSSTSTGKDHEIAITAPRQATTLVFNKSNLESFDEEHISVNILASVVDEDDMKAFNGFRHMLSGRFFAGKVKSNSEESFPAGAHVVGYQIDGSMNSTIIVPPSQIYTCAGYESLAHAAAYFASMCAGLCVVDGHTRARAGETFHINVRGVLGEVIKKYVHDYEAIILPLDAGEKADFVVDIDAAKGIMVNRIPVDVNRYLISERGKYMISKAWEEKPQFDSSFTVVELSDLQAAFKQGTPEAAYSSIIIHKNISGVNGGIAVYQKPRKMFSDGAYVIVGGLGGLGRYVCSWMVENGARKLFVISRSGVNSDEARTTFRDINATGASMEVIKADARDQERVSDALSKIRRRYLIKGVINMAVLLGDAPLDSMTGTEWDRALKLKIETSWILHEETLVDDLEFFIVFSSIASVLGNRNQAGYNVGNGFLNALTSYRRSKGLVGVSIGLGAMMDVGILYELTNRDTLLETLARSGLSPLEKHHLAKIMEAAISESHDSQSTRSFILTGLESFEQVDGEFLGSKDQTMLYWTGLPEFRFLHSYRKTWNGGLGSERQTLSLREQVLTLSELDACAAILGNFLAFLAGLLGFPIETFNSGSPTISYGLDSLSGVSCQHWFHREFAAKISAQEILNAKSFDALINGVYTQVQLAVE